MAFDRSKFKGSKIASVQNAQESAKKNDKRQGGSTNGQIIYHKIEDGDNWFRIAPPHDSTKSAYQAKRVAMLKCEVDKYDDKNEKTGEKEIKLKPIFIATQHSPIINGKQVFTKDIIETYVSYVYEKANEQFGNEKSDEKSKFLNPITGYRSKDKWTPGMRPQTTFECYAWDKSGSFGQLSLYPNWMKDIQQLSLRESQDDVSAIDVFSDPENGLPLIISKNKDDNKKYVYSIDADRPSRGENWDDFFKRTRPTDKQLMDFEEIKPLHEKFEGSYKESDFELALDGLKRFDDEHKYNIFENDDFLDEVEEISKAVDSLPKKDSEESEDKPEKEDVLSLVEKKTFLKKYVDENYPNMLGLPDYVKGEKLINEWYELAVADEQLPFTEEDESDLPFDKEKEEPAVKDLASKLDAIKNRMKK